MMFGPRLSTAVLPQNNSPWSEVPYKDQDDIMHTVDLYRQDSNPNKINLSIGTYRKNENEPYVLKCVRDAESNLVRTRQNKEYAPTSGLPEFCQASTRLVFGNSLSAIQHESLATMQTVGGTNALSIGATFINKFYPGCKVIYLSDPSWSYHEPIMRHASLEVRYYRYYNHETHTLDIHGAIQDIKNIPEKSIIIFQTCGHNPTGIDPQPEQWNTLSAIIKQRQLLVFMDSAYQGFASGDLDKDAYPVRKFFQDGHHLMVAQSYSKNMGLYGERVGALTVVCHNKNEAERVLSQLRLLTRPLHSSAPLHGALIAARILNDSQLYDLWRSELINMNGTILRMRESLVEHLRKAGSRKNWSHIRNRTGMFCLSGLTAAQCEKLIKDYSIYMTKDGRISMGGISPTNVMRVAQGIHEVTKD